MAVKPIIFSAPMVRALLDGRKTKDRRVVKPQPKRETLNDGELIWWHPVFAGGYKFDNIHDDLWEIAEAAPYQPSDILWVRETWRAYDKHRECACYDWCVCPPTGTPIYRADMDDGESKWRPSIHMPKWACRLFLHVTDVRVEQVQGISEADAEAEGAALPYTRECAVPQFQRLWDSINAKRGYGWDVNPWVWVYDFERTEKPEGWPEVG